MYRFVLSALPIALLLSQTATAGGMFFFEEPGDLSATMGPSTNPNRLGPNELNPRPPETYVGQWYTTPDGCSYSRAQAPGYPVHWYLILNPHHIGQPNAHAGCPTRL